MANNSLKAELILGTFYSGITKYSGIFVSLIISSILSRLLSPSDFGVVAVATVLIQFLNIISDAGIAPAIIQSKNLDKSDLNSIYSSTIYLGVILGGLLYFLSNKIGIFYSNAYLSNVCKILSITVFFSAINLVPNALILKAKEFKFIAKRTLIYQVTFGLISIISAYKGIGMYSLLINPVFSSISTFIINYIQYPQQFKFCPEANSLKKIYKFSIYQFSFDFLNFFSRNLDKMIIGKFLNLNELGFYEKSYRLMQLPVQNITHVLTPVIHPVFTNLNNKDKLFENYMKIIKVLSMISFPLASFLFFAADELIIIVFGPQWKESIEVFKILSISVSLQIILSSTGSMFQSANAAKKLFQNGLSNTFFTISGFLISSYIYKDVKAVAWAWDITLIINFFISYFLLINVVFKKSFKLLLNILVKPITYGFACSICLMLYNRNIRLIDNMLFDLLIQLLITLLIILMGFNMFNRNKIKLVINSFSLITQKK